MSEPNIDVNALGEKNSACAQNHIRSRNTCGYL